MAYLGQAGVLNLKRTSPEPVVLPTSAVNISGQYVQIDYDDWLLAEQVTLIHSSGFLQGFIHRDVLDRIYLHSTRAGALANDPATRLSFAGVTLSRPIVLAAGINTTQRTTLTSLQATLTTSTAETRLRAWPTTAATFNSQATANPWTLQGEIKSWRLSRSAPEIDTGVLGDKFGSSIKAVVSGSGSLDFLIDLYSATNRSDIEPILRLVQLTEYGSVAGAKFYLKQASSRTTCAGSPTPVNTSVFFKADLTLTEVSIDTSAEDLVAGSANFVTTGPIRLLSE